MDLHGEVLVGEAVDSVHDSVEHLATRAPAADELEALPDPHVLRLARAALHEAVARDEELPQMPVPLETVLPPVDAHPVAVRDAHVVGDGLLLRTPPGVVPAELGEAGVRALDARGLRLITRWK